MKKIIIIPILIILLSGCGSKESINPDPKPMPDRPTNLKVDTKGDSVCMPPGDYKKVMEYVAELEEWSKNQGGTR